MSVGKKYTVKFHFPYAAITLDDVAGWRMEGWTTYIRSGKVFTVESGTTTYTVNPALLTYMEHYETLPF